MTNSTKKRSGSGRKKNLPPVVVVTPHKEESTPRISKIDNPFLRRYDFLTKNSQSTDDFQLLAKFRGLEKDFVPDACCPFQYIAPDEDSDSEPYTSKTPQNGQAMPRLKEDSRDSSFDQWCQTMIALIHLRKEEKISFYETEAT